MYLRSRHEDEHDSFVLNGTHCELVPTKQLWAAPDSLVPALSHLSLAMTMLCLELLGSMAAIHRALDNPFLGDLYEEAIGTTGMYLFIILFAYDCLCLLLRSWTNWQRTWQTSRLGCQHCVQLMDNADPKIVSGNCSQAKVMEIQAKRRREWRTCANLVPAVSIYALGYTQIPLKKYTYIHNMKIYTWNLYGSFEWTCDVHMMLIYVWD